MPPAIRHYAARVGIDSAQQRLQPVVQPDHQRSRGQRLEIFWDKSHPRFFAGADDDDRH